MRGGYFATLFLKNESGFALVITILLTSALMLVGSITLMQTSLDLQIGKNYESSKKAFYAAEAGAEYGLTKLKQELQKLTPDIDGISAPSMTGFSFSGFSITAQTGSTQVLLNGDYAGLNAFVTRYTIRSKADATNGSSAEVTMQIEDQLIPLFQFGIFFEDDLEILPGANMTFSGGRIHTNSDLYMNSSATLSIDSIITNAGDIYHARKDKYESPGTVRIKDLAGDYQNMTIDSSDTDWVTESQTTWNGRVKTQDHGINELNLNIGGSDPAELIGTGSDSMEEKSGLKIVDGVAEDKDGFTVDVRYYDPDYKDADGNLIIDSGGTSSLNVNPISTSSFYDHREDTTVTSTDVDMAKLMNSSAAVAALNDPPSGGDQGTLWVSSSFTGNSVRLTNGSSLPSGGFTVATPDPVYIQGDYNLTNNPAAIISDAVTVLSNAWDDSNSTSTNLNDRVASNTTVNAAIMAGNVPTPDGGGNYSGGVENFFRFLENWSGKTFTYSGSIVCLWESQKATGSWSYGSPIYKAPTRNWNYGMSLSNMPPGTPRVRNVSRLAWKPVYGNE